MKTNHHNNIPENNNTSGESLPLTTEEFTNLKSKLKSKYQKYLKDDSDLYEKYNKELLEKPSGGIDVEIKQKRKELSDIIKQFRAETVLNERGRIQKNRNDITVELEELNERKKKESKYDDVMKKLLTDLNNLNNRKLFKDIKNKLPNYYVYAPEEKDLYNINDTKTETRLGHILVGIMFEVIGYITEFLIQKNIYLFLKGGRALQVQDIQNSESFDIDLLIKGDNNNTLTVESKGDLALQLKDILFEICSLEGLYDGDNTTRKLSFIKLDDKNLVKLSYSYKLPGDDEYTQGIG